MPAEGTPVVVWAGINGFQELDYDVENSLILVNNFEAAAVGGGAITNALTGGDTLADSYVYASKPAFFGALAWPPIGPATTLDSVADYEIIPAGYRFANDAAPPPSSTAVSVSGNASVGGTLSIGN